MLLISFIVSNMWETRIGARPADGSSSRRTLGSTIRALPMATICLCPPESLPAFSFRLSLNTGKRS